MRQHFFRALRAARRQFRPFCRTASAVCLLCLAFPFAGSADNGETIPTPVPYATYIFVPGKLTGQDFFLKKENLNCRIFSFDQFTVFPKPAEIVNLPFSLRGGYRAHDIFGHDDFEPKGNGEVATGWVPVCNGNFVIFPDDAKGHSPQWVPERTRLIRVPFIKQYGNTVVNAYDLALGLDRFNSGDLKSQSIEFKIVPITDDNGKTGKRLIPSAPLTEGVYYAYSLPDDKDTENYGFLFAVGTPSVVKVSGPNGIQSPAVASGIQLVDAKLAADVIDYALLSQAIYNFGTSKFKAPNGWEAVDPATLNCLLNPEKAFYNDPVNDFTIGAFIKGKSLVIVFKGTTTLVDWSTDAAAYMGKEPGQYKDALTWVNNLVERAGDNFQVTLTGHSLGGGLATYAALLCDKPAIVFNAAPMGTGMLSDIKNLDKRPLISNIDIKGDPVSALGGQSGTIFTLEIPATMMAQLGFVNNQNMLAGPSFATDELSLYHSIDTVVKVLQNLVKQ